MLELKRASSMDVSGGGGKPVSLTSFHGLIWSKLIFQRLTRCSRWSCKGLEVFICKLQCESWPGNNAVIQQLWRQWAAHNFPPFVTKSSERRTNHQSCTKWFPGITANLT